MMEIWVITFYIPGTGFGILEKAFLTKAEAEEYAAQNQDDVPSAQLTVDNVIVEVTLQ